jgi:predicted Zn finger-like uncharacterized protein
MQITCPNCHTSYDVSLASLGEGGRSVRCVRCRQVWFATPEGEPEPGPAEGAPMVSPAAVSAQYQKSAIPTHDEAPPAAPTDVEAGDDDTSVDPNLAARAAGRLSGELDDPAFGAAADHDASLAAHEAPPLAPQVAGDADRAAEAARAAAHAEDVETAAARRARRQAAKRAQRAGRPSLAILITVLFLVNAALLLWRSDVVRMMPQTASLYAAIGLPVNLRGLAFNDVTMSKEMHDGVTVLVVQGTIANVTRLPLDVPRVRFALCNAKGNEVYSWTTLPARSLLPPGEAQPLQTRLASPPAEGRELVMRFFNRRDAGIR